MRYFKCDNCNKKFHEDEASVVHTSYESFYGVSDLFPYSTPLSYYACPYCGDESLESFEAYECTTCYKIVEESSIVSINEENFCMECALDILSEYSLDILEKFCIECDYALDIFNANKHLSIRECLKALANYDEDIISDYISFIEEGGY